MPNLSDQYIQELAEKLLLGNITEREKAILDNWYFDKAENTPVWNLDNETKPELGDRLFKKIQDQIKVIKWRLPTWAKIASAASLVLAMSISLTVYYNYHQQKSNQQFNIAGTEGGIRKVLLPDQSIVWLKGNSRLEYPAIFSDSTRNVILHGEALFEIAKDKSHPFIILAGNYLTRVVGTSFNIKENQQSRSFKLTVLTGKVIVYSANANHSINQAKSAIEITPGKEFQSSITGSTPLISTAQPTVRAAVVQGTEYVMDFENTSFTDIKTRIERKFDVSIAADAIYGKCGVSANVTDQSLDNTLKVICAALGATYTSVNKKVNITGGGCN